MSPGRPGRTPPRRRKSAPAASRWAAAAAAVCAAACGEGAAEDRCAPGFFDGAPFAAEVVSFLPGPGAGFGQDGFPCVVLGPPVGGGVDQQSLDVLSLGVGGEVVVELGVDAVDGPGDDLIVFENPFLIGGTAVAFAEPGEVAVSADGVAFDAFPCTPTAPAYEGCAGVRPVVAPGPDGALDPTDPAQAGGDAFDLAAVGLARARFVRVRDVGPARGGADTRGFDLDALAVVHH